MYSVRYVLLDLNVLGYVAKFHKDLPNGSKFITVFVYYHCSVCPSLDFLAISSILRLNNSISY